MSNQSGINWVQITAGAGVNECALAVKNIMGIMEKEGAEYGLRIHLIESVTGHIDNTIISALYEFQGNEFNKFISKWKGTIQWICKSPYRPNHKRKNWFIGVNVLSIHESKILLQEKDLKFDFMRASGPGGQHINKTDSAVRVTHIPTGENAKAQEMRSQHLNKKLALDRLQAIFQCRYINEKDIRMKELWNNHHKLKRGNPRRVFVGSDFKEKKE
ncbi:MAG: peptide chain release factor H [Legionellales bacterium]|nr:peptide chain release factor H [Legionellales bacterium]